MKRISLVCIMLACINWAQQESNTTQEKPQVNFKGTLVDTSGQVFSVENITISGLYKNIPFYSVPADPTGNPESNTTLIDLNEIEEISSPHGKQKELFNNRPFYKVAITLKNKAQQTYIVEASRKIFCDIRINGGSIEKRLAFESLQKLSIGEHEAQQAKADEPSRPVGEHEHECAQAGKVLQELTQEVEKVPEPHKNKLSQLLDAVKNWVGGICSTVSSKK